MAVNKTALVTGASGLLGREVVTAFEQNGWTVIGTALSRTDPPRIVQLDLRNADNVTQVLDEYKPAVIVHAAANRSPDSVAADPSASLDTNVHATGDLVKQASDRGIFTLYISTDYVFPGTLPLPDQDPSAIYRTTDKTHPINGYGLTKLKGEVAMLTASVGKTLANGAPAAIALRIPVLYGHVPADDVSRDGMNILVQQLETAVKSAHEGEVKATNVVDFKADTVIIRYPTWTGDIARVCVDVCDEYTSATADKAKTFPTRLQFSSQEPLTRYDMAVRLCNILGYDQTPFATSLATADVASVKATSDSPIRIIPDSSSSAGAIATTEALVREGVSEKDILKSTARPIHGKLDVSELTRLGIRTDAVKFNDWWRRELKAYRRT